MWYYKRTEPQLWTVGCDDAKGRWTPDSDHDNREDAARRAAFLNGDCTAELERLRAEVERLTVAGFDAAAGEAIKADEANDYYAESEHLRAERDDLAAKLAALLESYSPAWYYQMGKTGYECAFCGAVIREGFSVPEHHRPDCAYIGAMA